MSADTSEPSDSVSADGRRVTTPSLRAEGLLLRVDAQKFLPLAPHIPKRQCKRKREDMSVYGLLEGIVLDKTKWRDMILVESNN